MDAGRLAAARQCIPELSVNGVCRSANRGVADCLIRHEPGVGLRLRVGLRPPSGAFPAR